MKQEKGFTLIELMIVVSIIGILASISLPAYQRYVMRSEMVDALTMAEHVKNRINKYYEDHLGFPSNNLAGGIPLPNQLISNRVTETQVINGAIHITLGNKAAQPLQGKVISFRPAIVSGSPTSPIAWLCGFAEPVNGMQAIGENRTDIDRTLLPSACLR